MDHHRLEEDPSLEGYDLELIRRIRAWAEGAAGIYCINDVGDHMDYVDANHYRVTGTGWARRVASWWLDTYEWPRATPSVAWVAARRDDDGAEVRMAFKGYTEAIRVYQGCTTLELEAALDQNPKRARA
jgi:hypothetical protein